MKVQSHFVQAEIVFDNDGWDIVDSHINGGKELKITASFMGVICDVIVHNVTGSSFVFDTIVRFEYSLPTSDRETLGGVLCQSEYEYVNKDGIQDISWISDDGQVFDASCSYEPSDLPDGHNGKLLFRQELDNIQLTHRGGASIPDIVEGFLEEQLDLLTEYADLLSDGIMEYSIYQQ